MGKVFLQKFVHTKNNSSFLAMKNKPSCRSDCSWCGRLRMLPALGSGWQLSWRHLSSLPGWGCGSTQAGGTIASFIRYGWVVWCGSSCETGTFLLAVAGDPSALSEPVAGMQ